MGYSGPVVDPFRIPAPDGQVYFDVLTPPSGLLPLYVVLATHVRAFQSEVAAANYPAAKAYWSTWALRFQKGIVDLEGAMRAAAIEAAQVADSVAKQQIAATQVRPDTSKARHMEDNLVSRRIGVGAAELGAAGIFDISVLDRTAQGGGTYWEAQEFGTTAHVGREVKGFFQPGNAAPSQASFRSHPEFQAGRGPKMTIRNPIMERGFLRTGVEAAWRARDVRIRQAAKKVSKLIADYRRSVAPPPPPGFVPRGVRRR
jgi:hypothetical protein